MRMNRPTVTITVAITERCSTGRMSATWSTSPSTNEMASVAKKASQYDRPHWMSWYVTYVVAIASSPWAKLTTCVAR
jgi:hypothetical protein